MQEVFDMRITNLAGIGIGLLAQTQTLKVKTLSLTEKACVVSTI